MSSERTFPFYENRQIFSTDENILKKQLKESEIMQLFKERRAEQTKHPHRPRYHFTSPIGIINDPNGLCFWNDSWHLFYQLMLNDTVYWGHAKSSDLINWEDLPPAIYPDNTFQCWSGGTCVDGDRVIAMYYGFPKGIMISTSTDPLLVNWTRLQQEPVIKIADIPKFPQDGSTIPDPFLWKEGNTYYALIGGIQAHPVSGGQMRQMYLYSSEDLFNWNLIKGFLDADSFADIFDDGACPYFVPLEERHLIMHFSHRHGARFILGNYDKTTYCFKMVNSGILSRDCWFGGVHAPSVFSDGHIANAIFNINCSEYPVIKDNQMMVLPRKYSVCGKDRNQLCVNVNENIKNLRGKHFHIENVCIPSNQEVCIKEIQGKSMELVAEFSSLKVPYIEIKVLCTDDNSEYTRIQLYPRRSDRVYEGIKKDSYWQQRENYKSALIIDSSHASICGDILPPPPVREDVYLDPEENISLRIFIDQSIVEVYINGRATAAIRAYPSLEGSNKIKFSSGGKETKLLSLDAWEIKTIY